MLACEAKSRRGVSKAREWGHTGRMKNLVPVLSEIRRCETQPAQLKLGFAPLNPTCASANFVSIIQFLTVKLLLMSKCFYFCASPCLVSSDFILKWSRKLFQMPSLSS